mmetsp:Transcript_57663/g.151757  ORF Transcript_57663/g.151757 Transcript_57663/m.151757 type:complete len:100 (-) Transcript_57663:277-576(-)
MAGHSQWKTTSLSCLSSGETLRKFVSFSGTPSENQSAEKAVCCVCMERTPDVILVPCGHDIFCRQCIVETLCVTSHSIAPRCPLCRSTIESIVLLDGGQ